jgi:hypothetical protein
MTLSANDKADLLDYLEEVRAHRAALCNARHAEDGEREIWYREIRRIDNLIVTIKEQ